MPSKYDPNAALPLRIPPELRELRARLAALATAADLPLNSVAVAALARGVVVLEQAHALDAFAVHRALKGEPAPAVAAPPLPSASSPTRPRPARPGAPPAPAAPPPARPQDAADPHADPDELRARWLAAKLATRSACTAAGANRPSVQKWLKGGALSPGQRALVTAYLDKIAAAAPG